MPVIHVKIAGHTDSKGITRAFIETHLEDLARQQKWSVFTRVLALSIYGLVLFPSASDIIDQAAMEVFFAVEKNGRNPVPAVLAETFLTLSFCHQKQKGKLRCCLHLLYVWIMTHMYAGSHIKSASDPLRSFYLIPAKQREIQEWSTEFDNVDERSFKWVCPWYGREKGDIIYSCGRFSNVPLMGPRGCVSYTPALVLKQVCWTQKKPREEQLGGLYFWYNDGDHTRKLSGNVRDAWRDIHMAGKEELGKPLVITTREYIAWREARKVSKEVHNAPSEDQENCRLTEQIEIMKAQMKCLEQQKEAADWELIIARDQCEKKAKIIEHLKDELADSPGQVKFKEEVRRHAKEKKEFLQNIRRLEKENEELKAKANHEERMRKELESEVYNQYHQKKGLEQQIEDLNTHLAQVKEYRDQESDNFMRCQNRLHHTNKAGRFWKKQAGDWAMKAVGLTDQLDEHMPKFIHHFEKADEAIQQDFKLHLPKEVDDFMDVTRSLTKGLKRKKTKLLM